ncbi:hypothetical protein ABKA04_004428 [Annulohypoxylon sp. FPYF3050]
MAEQSRIARLSRELKKPGFKWIKDKSVPQSEGEAGTRLRRCQRILKQFVAISRVYDINEDLETVGLIGRMFCSLDITIQRYSYEPSTDTLVGNRLVADVDHLRPILRRVLLEALARGQLSAE